MDRNVKLPKTEAEKQRDGEKLFVRSMIICTFVVCSLGFGRLAILLIWGV